jgi:molecular chaperone HtpG
VKTYSDHIPFPIELLHPTKDEDADTRLNEASALWTRNKSEVDEQQYKEFYHHVAHAFDDPWLTLHFRAEGVIEYTGLVYIPTERPLDLFHPERLSKLKLYVKRVFITEDCDDLLPSWLRFLRGVIDSEDLPLNVSREMLQNNPVVGKIKTGLVKRVLAELGKKAETDAEGYANFWDKFGLVLKEGLYEGGADKETLLKLCRFRSTKRDGLISLDDYVADMKEGQDAIYYISGEGAGALKKSPQLEGFDAKGVEVLLMTDPVDEFWLSTIFDHDGKPFKSVTRAGADLSKIKKDGETEDEKKDDEAEAVVDGLVIALKLALGDAVKDVRASDRLTSSAVCLVADENAMDMHLERLLKQHNKLEHSSPRILEINPDHALIQALTAKAGPDGKGDLGSAPKLLLDQARILEGETLPDPADFARNMADVMAKAFG